MITPFMLTKVNTINAIFKQQNLRGRTAGVGDRVVSKWNLLTSNFYQFSFNLLHVHSIYIYITRF